MQKVAQDTMYDLRKEIFDHLQRLPMSFYDRSPVGRLVTRVTTDVDALNDLFTTGVAAMVNDAFLLVLFVFIMLQMNWRLALATFAVMPLIFLATWMFRNSVRDANRRIRTAIARINAFLQEHISGMSVVQLFNRERKARAQFAELNRLHMVAYKDAILAFRPLLPRGRIPRRRRHPHRVLVRRARRPGGNGTHRHTDRLHAVRAAFLPAHSGPQRKIQHPADGHDRLRAHLQTPR